LAHFDDRAVRFLTQRLQDPVHDTRSRSRAARALAGIASPMCVEAVFDCLESAQPGVAYQLLKTLSKLRNSESGLLFPVDRVRAALRAATRIYWELLQTQELLPTAGGRGITLLHRTLGEKRDQYL
jgi:HEAT repeat protein